MATMTFTEILADYYLTGLDFDTFVGDLTRTLVEEFVDCEPTDEEFDALYRSLAAFAQGLDDAAQDLTAEQNRAAAEDEREFQQTKRQAQGWRG